MNLKIAALLPFVITSAFAGEITTWNSERAFVLSEGSAGLEEELTTVPFDLTAYDAVGVSYGSEDLAAIQYLATANFVVAIDFVGEEAIEWVTVVPTPGDVHPSIMFFGAEHMYETKKIEKVHIFSMSAPVKLWSVRSIDDPHW